MKYGIEHLPELGMWVARHGKRECYTFSRKQARLVLKAMARVKGQKQRTHFYVEARND
jgi:hypothetical protein